MQRFVEAMVQQLCQVPCPRGPFTRGLIELDAESIAAEYARLPASTRKELTPYRERFSELMTRPAKLYGKAQKLIAKIESLTPPDGDDDLGSLAPREDDDRDDVDDEWLDDVPDVELALMTECVQTVAGELASELDERRSTRERSRQPSEP